MTTPTAATVAEGARADTALVQQRHLLHWRSQERVAVSSAWHGSSARVLAHGLALLGIDAPEPLPRRSPPRTPPPRKVTHRTHFSRRVGVTTGICSTSIRFARPWAPLSGSQGPYRAFASILF